MQISSCIWYAITCTYRRMHHHWQYNPCHRNRCSCPPCWNSCGRRATSLCTHPRLKNIILTVNIGDKWMPLLTPSDYHQIAKTLRSIRSWERFDTKLSNQCVIEEQKHVLKKHVYLNNNMNMEWHTNALTHWGKDKRSLFCKRHFQMHFLEQNLFSRLQ